MSLRLRMKRMLLKEIQRIHNMSWRKKLRKLKNLKWLISVVRINTLKVKKITSTGTKRELMKIRKLVLQMLMHLSLLKTTRISWKTRRKWCGIRRKDNLSSAKLMKLEESWRTEKINIKLVKRDKLLRKHSNDGRRKIWLRFRKMVKSKMDL